ncbi:MAG TPA: hypothetical protein VJN21_12355 [Candidatus Acidoferrales bacterium]|nr:hypothetical protein [Candidatus Acidoferrales bacterium]
MIGLLALAALVVLSFDTYRTWLSARATRDEIARLTSQVRTEQQQQDALRAEFNSKAVEQTMARSANLNGLIAERAFPWTKMFADLERILPPGVRVISISPGRDKDGNINVSLSMGAESDAAKLRFLESLEASQAFSDILVKSESRPTQARSVASSDRVLLALEVRYKT